MNDFSLFVEALKGELCKLNINVVSYDIIDSTNTQAKAYAACAADLEDPVLFVAKAQSAGRGRLGREFVSRDEGSIYMTLLYFTNEELSSAVTVTTAVAAHAARAIEDVTGESVGIKWVNDIYNDQGKVAGILVESVPKGGGRAVAVGIGINVGVAEFAPEIKDIAASLAPLGDKEKAGLVAQICKGVMSHVRGRDKRAYMSDYRRMFILEGKTVDIYVAGEHKLRGVVTGVDDDGGLVVSHGGKADVFSSGEITVRIVK